MIGTRMVSDGRTARQIFEDLMATPPANPFGFGAKLAVVNVDVQNAYTRIDEFATAYETDPLQIDHINRLSAAARAAGMPVVWTQVAYAPDGSDCGVWGTRTDTPDSLQNIKYGSRRHALDDRCDVEPGDTVFTKRMPSAFFETPLQSLLVFHKVDTVVITGGSTSGCVRATADKHESPHFANLTDLRWKYADVEPVQAVIDWLQAR